MTERMVVLEAENTPLIAERVSGRGIPSIQQLTGVLTVHKHSDELDSPSAVCRMSSKVSHVT